MSWMQTFLGNRFIFEGPFNFDIKDIAHSLALQCRFNGHCKEMYSVADHSLHVSARCEHKLWGLMHDAAETYIGDIVAPFKHDSRWYPSIKEVEDRIMKAIAARFNLPWPIPAEVKNVDLRMWATEQRDLMNKPLFVWVIDTEPYPEKIVSRGNVEELFLRRFYLLNRAYSFSATS